MSEPPADPFVVDAPPEAARPGPLHGVRVAVKDNFDVAGLPTGLGNPDWGRLHPVAVRDARAVELLRGAGVVIVGKAHTDEFAYSLAGDNSHFPALDNPAAPGHLVGGSSSGSAAAVAAGLAELGLGSDTAGSIRVPAAYCGLYGLRPTWGRASVDGLAPLAPSFDAVGLLAREVEVLRAGFDCLVEGLFERVSVGGLRQGLFPSMGETAGQAACDRVFGALAPSGAQTVDIEAAIGMDWTEPFATVQGAEFWAAYGPWITEHKPRLTEPVAGRIAAAAQIGATSVARARQQLDAVRDGVRALVGDTPLLIPTTPEQAPLRGQVSSSLRQQLLRLTTLASLSGLPAVSIPVSGDSGVPLGVSILGPENSEHRLLALAEAWEATPGERNDGRSRDR